MLKYCVETMFGNNGEGLLQACISSYMLYLQLMCKYFISSWVRVKRRYRRTDDDGRTDGWLLVFHNPLANGAKGY